ncbi:glycosyltransferase [Ruminococcus sp. AF17-24]|jgi:glycosyltransferase involved in cell wall biosynthesis|uniref:glycosyltransferase n=3 Tax=unclassified Ruminococcus TaxID=2608920 RepID=UPI000E487941|nr:MULTISPECIES: glycosyltransferase [unclassified Ruminococcus]RGG70449.1 glycosyltransferase [Ruminococcus sp. AF17-24]RGG77590.1 glycosyltransferase [Ruminococcus sp. AF17-1AC]
MNILFIDLHCDATMPSGANEFGGGNTYSRGLLKGIIRNENLFCVYVTRKKYDFFSNNEKISDNCFIERLKLGDSADDKDTLQNYIDKATDKIRVIIDKYNLHNFIIHSSYWQSGIIALKLSKEYGTYYIHTIQSNGKKKKLVNSKQIDLDKRIASEELVFKNAKYLICSSIAEQEEIHNLYNIDYDRLILTGLPIAQEFSNPSHDKYGNVSTYSISQINVNSYLPLGYSANCLETWWINGPFLYYGRLHIDKGILEIIRAWSQLFEIYGDKTPPLWIAGGTPKQIAYFRETLFEMGVHIDDFENNNKIIWWGTLSPSELSCLLIKSMVLVTHSKYESGGLMIIEALATSTAVIATPFGYAKNYIYDWFNGFVVDHGNIELLKMRMSHFIENPYLSDLLSKNAKLTYDEIANSIDFLKIHFELYSGLKPDVYKPSVKALTQTNSNVLGCQNILNKHELDNHIRSFLKSSNYTFIKSYTSSDSLVVIIKYMESEYRVDIWLNTLNPRRFLSDKDPYIITSTDKINMVLKYHKNKLFQGIDYFSVCDKLSITRCSSTNKPVGLKQAIMLMDEAFTCNEQAPSDPALSERIKRLFLTFNRYSIYVKDAELISKLKELFESLKQFNNKRKKLCFGFTPCLSSTDNICGEKLHGIFNCIRSEYGYNIAMVFSVMGIFPCKNKLLWFNGDQWKSIVTWYVYLQLESVVLDLIHYPNKTQFNRNEKLIDLLK